MLQWGMDAIDDLRMLIERHAGGGVKRTILPGVSIASAIEPTETMSGMSEPSLAVVAQGIKETSVNGRPYRYRAGEFLVVSVDLPVTGHIVSASADEPFSVFSMSLRPAMIAELLLESNTVRDRPPAFSGLAVSAAAPDLLDPIARLLRLLDRPDDIPVLWPAYEREIVWRLLTGEQGGIVRQIGLADGRLAQISRSIRWIRQHSTETIRIDDLAAMAGLSVSSFHRHFRAVTSMTPIQFHKQIRLQEARTLLMTRPHDVAEIGYLVGYDSPSQFSREYRRAFGEPPGRDAARLASAEDAASRLTA
ncbi:MAG TPA: AraC family transcriptional regulator [Lacisediminihabitans sp.]|uniref:AraC family transcriptional regulator n=1 Tax=Lacisediminihabitans sp. TaxID=2787631 RepID=UPI002ED8463F